MLNFIKVKSNVKIYNNPKGLKEINEGIYGIRYSFESDLYYDAYQIDNMMHLGIYWVEDFGQSPFTTTIEFPYKHWGNEICPHFIDFKTGNYIDNKLEFLFYSSISNSSNYLSLPIYNW